MNTEITSIERNIRVWTLFFMAAIILSGLTAIPVQAEINWLLNTCLLPEGILRNWLLTVQADLKATPLHVMYGFDWLAFAHIVIAIAFIGVLKNPVKNIWVIEFGMLACIAILPFAFLMGTIRNIPFWWQLIDCSFGLFGLIPLCIVRQKIKQLEQLTQALPNPILF